MAPRAKTSFCGSRLVRSTLALVFIAALGVGYALLGRSASPAATTAATAFRLDHFQCYRVKPPGAFTPRRVTLVDQFGKSKAVASQVTTLCAPVSKNKSVVRNRLAHLACYPITRKPRFRPRRATITNQFEKATPVVVVKPVQLCLPSGKTLFRPRPASGEGARPLPVLPGQAAAETAAATGSSSSTSSASRARPLCASSASVPRFARTPHRRGTSGTTSPATSSPHAHSVYARPRS